MIVLLVKEARVLRTHGKMVIRASYSKKRRTRSVLSASLSVTKLWMGVFKGGGSLLHAAWTRRTYSSSCERREFSNMRKRRFCSGGVRFRGPAYFIACSPFRASGLPSGVFFPGCGVCNSGLLVRLNITPPTHAHSKPPSHTVVVLTATHKLTTIFLTNNHHTSLWRELHYLAPLCDRRDLREHLVQ